MQSLNEKKIVQGCLLNKILKNPNMIISTTLRVQFVCNCVFHVYFMRVDKLHEAYVDKSQTGLLSLLFVFCFRHHYTHLPIIIHTDVYVKKLFQITSTSDLS